MSIDKKEKRNTELFSRAQCQRNVRIFQFTGFNLTVLAVPVLVLVWLEVGLTFHEMLLLQGLFVLPILILEVPSGSLSDYWSRKSCISFHYLLFGLAMFIYTIGNSFFMFAIAELLAGVAVTFQTGSDTALVYDSMLTQGKATKSKFGKIVSQRMTIMFIGGALAALVGGLIGSLSMIRMPLGLVSIGHLIYAGLTFWGYSEPPRKKARTPKAAITKAITSMKNQSELVIILLFSLTGFVFARIGFWAVQHILVEEFLFNALAMGFIFAGFNICAATSSLLIKSRVNQVSKFSVFLIILIIDGSYFWMLIQVPGLIGIVLVFLLGQVTRGIRTPLIQTLLQQYINSDERATFISLMSCVGSFLYFAFSVIIDSFDFSRDQALILCFLSILLITLIFLAFFAKEKWRTLISPSSSVSLMSNFRKENIRP